MPSQLKSILRALIGYPSITPHDAGTQDFMIHFLERLGFSCRRFNQAPVSNFYATYGKENPMLVFAGHTDVVDPGLLTAWQHDPFTLYEQNDLLFGRGVADMKGSLAAMLSMAERFVKAHPNPKGSLGFLITSGEEGNDFNKGTPFVLSELAKQQEIIDYCIVGEPSSHEQLGDMIKIGRRGSLNGVLTLKGKQGHVAYPDLADNPIHRIAPVLKELAAYHFDEGDKYFSATSLQMTGIHSGGHGNNVIPGEITVQFNCRFSPNQTADMLKNKIMDCFKSQNLSPDIQWQLSGEPFLTRHGLLVEETVRVIHQKTGRKPVLSTSGGTSDARFIAPYGIDVLELGPVNKTIHQVNECVSLSDLVCLSDIYYQITENLVG